VGPKAGLDALEKNLNPAGNRTAAVQPVAIPTEVSRLRPSWSPNKYLTKYFHSLYLLSSKVTALISPMYQETVIANFNS
jgi:hypothetical protein